MMFRTRPFAFAAAFLFLLSAGADDSAKPAGIVDLKQIDPSILVDMMYATEANFVGRNVVGYKDNVCYLAKSAADALATAQARVKKEGLKTGRVLSLLVRDCYRPQRSVLDFVKWASDESDVKMKGRYYPDLKKAELVKENYISPVSGHSRASSVDLTIVEIKDDGDIHPLPMGTIIDFFGVYANTDHVRITREEREARQLLKSVLSPEFKNYPKEWWHYVLREEAYPKQFFDFEVEKIPARRPQSVTSMDITTQFTDAGVLAQLDRDNRSALSLVNIFKRIHEENSVGVPAFDQTARSTGQQLSRFTETYGKVAATIQTDVEKLIADLGIDWEKDITKTYDPKSAKTPAGKIHRGNGNVTRFFNEKWLTSSVGQFLLAGVVNRIDRREFTPGTCGEVRLIYRLGYETQIADQSYASRTPFTVNMVFSYKDDFKGCRDVAASWNLQSVKADDAATVAKRILEGPADFSKLVFKQMEINAQIARFPSDLENVENRKFAGQAIYLMRIFGVKNGGFVAKKLENTPDVTAISKNPALKTQLKDFIAKNLPQINNGAFQIPDSLLADVAITYSTLGSSRLANKPFDLLFSTTEAQQIFSNANWKQLPSLKVEADY